MLCAARYARVEVRGPAAAAGSSTDGVKMGSKVISLPLAASRNTPKVRA
jgi:hypothetical protein